MTSVDRLFVAASMTQPDPPLTGRDLERIHRTQGYSRIAVHFAIERDGTVHEGRPLDLPGALAGNANGSAIQVCLLGGLNADLVPTNDFTPEQLDALRRLRDRFGLPVVFDRYCPLKET